MTIYLCREGHFYTTVGDATACDLAHDPPAPRSRPDFIKFDRPRPRARTLDERISYALGRRA